MIRTPWKCLVFAAVLVAVPGSAAEKRPGETPRRIDITASKYSFHPSEITLKRGEPVVLSIRSTDATHGLEIKELGVKVEAPKGRTVEIPLTPKTDGEFKGKCSHFCGLGHGSMILTVDVVE